MQPSIPWSSSVSVFVIERMAIIHSLKCTVMFLFVVLLLSLAVTHCHLFSSLSLVVPHVVTLYDSLYHSLSFVIARCHSLSLVITHCHSLSFFVTRFTTRCHSLSLIVPLAFTRCHSLSLAVPLVVTCCHSLSLVVICCPSLLLDVPLVCLFINDQFHKVKHKKKL